MILTIYAPRTEDDLVVEWGELVMREKDEKRMVTDYGGYQRYIGDDDPIQSFTGRWMWNPPQWPLPHNFDEHFWDKRRDGTWYHGSGGFDLTSYNMFLKGNIPIMRLAGFYPLVDKVRQGEGTMERDDNETVRCWWQMRSCVIAPWYPHCTATVRIWPVYSKPL